MNLSVDFGQFLNRIWDAASIYFARPRSRVERFARVANRLRAKLKDVEQTNDEADRNGQTATAEARLWKSEAEAFVSTEVDAIQQDYEAMRCLGGWSWNYVSINRRVTRKLEAVNELIGRVDGFSIAATRPPPPSVELPISKNVVGMRPDPIQIVNQIRDENVRVIGIYGMELITCVGTSASSSISLRLLSLDELPKLNCISQQPLTFLYLEQIYIFACPKLRKLPFRADICHNKLKGIFGRTGWWENLEWEDVNDKNALFPYFKSTRQPMKSRLLHQLQQVQVLC